MGVSVCVCVCGLVYGEAAAFKFAKPRARMICVLVNDRLLDSPNPTASHTYEYIRGYIHMYLLYSVRDVCV